MASHVLSEYSDYEIFLELNHIPDPYPFEKIEFIPRERITQTNTRNPKPQLPIQKPIIKKVDFQSTLPLRPIAEKQTENLDETTYEELDPKFDPAEKFKNFFQNNNKPFPMEDPLQDNGSNEKFKKIFNSSASKYSYSQPEPIESSKVSALAMKYLSGQKPYRPEYIPQTQTIPQQPEGFAQPNNIAINRTLSSESNNSSALPPNNLTLSKNTSFESTGSSKAIPQQSQKQNYKEGNSFEDGLKASFSSQPDSRQLKSTQSTDDAKKLSPGKPNNPPDNGPSQAELLLMNELQAVSAKVETLREENNNLRKEKEALLSEHKLRVNEVLLETKQACEKEASEKIKKIEAEKEALQKEVFQLKQEKLLAERQSITLRQQVLDFDSVSAKLEACTAEKNYFENELKKTKLARLQLEEELNRKMEESMMMMAEYEKKIKTMGKQLEAMNLLKESDMTMNNVKNDQSFISDTTLDFDTSPWKKNPDFINFNVGGGENKFN